MTSAMLIGAAVGIVVGVVSTLVIHTSIRPDAVIGAVLGVPTALGLALIAISGRRWITTLGAFILAIAPGWFAVLVLIQVVHGA